MADIQFDEFEPPIEDMEEWRRQVKEFLEETIAVRVLSEIHKHEGSRFKELKEKFASPNTVNKRLKEAENLALVEKGLVNTPERTEQRYLFTELGHQLRQEMIDNETDWVYDQLRRYEWKLDQKVDSLQEWVDENLPSSE